MQVSNTINGVDVDRLFGTIEHISAEPTLARFQLRARNEWIDGGHNRTEIKGFYGAGKEDASRTEPIVLHADEPPVLLGKNQAPNAPEYLLHALAACVTGTLSITPPCAGSRSTVWSALSRATWTCTAFSASTRPSAPATSRSGSHSRPPAISTTISSPSSPAL